MFADAMPMVTFRTAQDFLQGLRPKTFNQVVSELHQFRTGTRIVEIARALDFDQRDELKTLAVVFDLKLYVEEVVNLIGELFPLNPEASYEMAWDGDFGSISIEPQGMNVFSDEELNELVIDPTGWEADVSLTIFVFYLFAINHVWEEAWDLAAEHFGWTDVPFPADTEGNNYLDEDALREQLQQVGMEPFMGLLPFGIFGENPFFIWRPYDSYDNSYFEFTLDTVRWLQDQWAEAVEIINQKDEAERMAQEDPGCYARFLACWRASLRERVEVGI